MLNCRWELDWESIVSRKFWKKCIRHGSATRFKVKIFYCCSSAIKRESGELCSTHCLSFIYYYVVIVLPATNFNRNHNQFHFIPRKISSYMAYICILFFYSNTITSIYTWIIKKSSFGLLPYTRNCSLAIQIDFTSFSSFPGLKPSGCDNFVIKSVYRSGTKWKVKQKWIPKFTAITFRI